MWSYKMTYSSSGLFNVVLLMCAVKTFARSIDNENSRGYRTEIEHVLDDFHRRLLSEAERLTQFEDGLHIDHSRGFQQHGYPTADFVGRHQVDNLRRHDDHRIKSQPNRNIQVEKSYASNIDKTQVIRNMHEFGRNHKRNGSYRDNSEYISENVNRNQQNRGVINNPVREDNFKSGSSSSEEIDENSRLDNTSCNTTENKQDKASNRTLEKQYTNIETSSNSDNYSSKTLRTNKPPAISGVNRQYNGKEYTVWPNDADYEKTTKAYEIKKNSTEPVKSTHMVEEVTPKSVVKGSNVSEIDDLEDRIAFDAPCPDGKKRVNGICVEPH